MNRQLLGSSGLALNDDDYACAIAAMGSYFRTETDGTVSMGWRPQNFVVNRTAAGPSPTPAAWLEYRKPWNLIFERQTDHRLFVDSALPSDRPTLDLCEILEILAHPAVKAAAVSIQWLNPEADLRWQWPLRLGAFDDDFKTLQLDRLKNMWPASTLLMPAILQREAARVEILVINAGPRAALARVLSLQHRVRAGLIILAAPTDVTWRALRPQLEALLTETQAGGLVIFPLLSPGELPMKLNTLIQNLSHDHPLDVATSAAAPDAIMVFDPRLIHAAGVHAAAAAVGGRLRRMAPSIALDVPEITRGRIDLQWTRGQPPASLGVELEARAQAGTLPVEREIEAASAMAEIHTAARAADRTAAPDDAPRYLQGNVAWFVDGNEKPETRGLAVGQRYALDVFIAPGELGALRADRVFPDDTIEWPEDEKITLQMLFTEPNQWAEPMRGTLKVGRTGRSDTCRFVLEPTKPGPFAGRVTLYYRGRVLQTALLKTRVVKDATALVRRKDKGMSLRVEVAFRRSMRNLDDRRRFDALLVCNHTSLRKAAITAAATDGAYIASLGNSAAAMASINRRLTDVAHDTRSFTSLTGKETAKLFVDLALEGNTLYRTLVVNNIQRSTAAKQVRDSEYLQVVTMAADALVPLEFVYEYPPANPGAAVCKNARKALRDGNCPASCRPTESPAPHVCPMGFWGLSKVIERHMNVTDLDKVAKVLGQKRSEPEAGRDTLSLRGATLLATSKQVTAKQSKALDSAIRKLREAAGDCVSAPSWKAWKQNVTNKKPVLLVALPHAAGAGAKISLEIGGDTRISATIGPDYIHVAEAPPPIAILLGCDTANTALTDAYLRHVDVFRDGDAALVVGTVATVLGTDAANMAERLLKHLVTTARKTPGRFGEVLRATKRAAVADSLLIGLCLVAFGDADWSVTT
jgi:hypothetical protein